MTDLDKIKARLRALRAKTVANGCTEEEAMAAAEKAAELLARHNLSDADLAAAEFDELGCERGRARTPLDTVWREVGRFADCTGFFRRVGTRWHYVYFGRASDVLVAEYVHQVIEAAAQRALREFRASASYARRRTPKTRAHAAKAFLEGFATSISDKLSRGLWKRYWTGNAAGTANALAVTSKAVTAVLEARHPDLRPMAPIGAAKGRFRDDAKLHGARAGQAVTIQARLAGGGNKVAGLLR